MLPRTTKPQAPTTRLTDHPPTELRYGECRNRGPDVYPICYRIVYRTGRNGLLSINTVSQDKHLKAQVQRSITADDLMGALDELGDTHGAPTFLRCDNGPEIAAFAVADWCRCNHASTKFIDPGSPWQNGHIESINSRSRGEYLNGHLFDSLLEAQVLILGEVRGTLHRG